MNFQELKKHEKTLTIVFFGLMTFYFIARWVTEYLLDPDALLSIIISQVAWFLFLYAIEKLRSNRTIIPSNRKMGGLQVIYIIFLCLVAFAMVYGSFAKLFDNFSRLSTASPFFTPTRENLLSNFKSKYTKINNLHELINQSNDNFFIDFKSSFNQIPDGFRPMMKELNLISISRNKTETQLDLFRSTKKVISYVSTTAPSNDSRVCEKIEQNWYLCYLDRS
jgi:hypothetical protein